MFTNYKERFQIIIVIYYQLSYYPFIFPLSDFWASEKLEIFRITEPQFAKHILDINICIL